MFKFCRFLTIPGWAGAALALACGGGCERARQDTPTGAVVVYTSVDEPFARDILELFRQKTGIKVEALYDTEGGKTTGFVRRLEREQARPRCDVWWSNEAFGTIELARQNVLEPYVSPSAADIPAEWKDPQGRWTGLALRERVLVYNPTKLTGSELPALWQEVAEPGWARDLAIANPQFGTTRGHVAAQFAYWGDEAAAAWLRGLRAEGAQIADGNAQVVRLVASGAALLGVTDSDDVWVAKDRGDNVAARRLRITDGGPFLWIPCTVGVVRGGPNPGAARKLADFLISDDVELALGKCAARHVPVRVKLRAALGLESVTPAAIALERVADKLEISGKAAREILLQ